jgi:hypothetical protein
VHVVLPDTPAANQARISKLAALGTTDSSDSVGSKSKWPGKSSSTLFEKLRADFGSASKSTLERVAQIRLQKADPTLVLRNTKMIFGKETRSAICRGGTFVHSSSSKKDWLKDLQA